MSTVDTYKVRLVDSNGNDIGIVDDGLADGAQVPNTIPFMVLRVIWLGCNRFALT